MNIDNQHSVSEPYEVEDALMEDMEDAIDHGILVSHIASHLSRQMGMEEHFCEEMSRAGMIHDIGKLKLGGYLYGRRQDTLRVEEMKYVRMHPTIGYDLLKDMIF